MPSDLTDFESKHATEIEPWNYTDRAAEILRHEWVNSQADRLDPERQGVLDVGCSFGQLSARLVRTGLSVTSIDVSPSAVAKCQQQIQSITLKENQRAPQVVVGSGTDIPFSENSFQVVLFSDGLIGWELSTEQKKKALCQAWRVLRPGGYLVLTDYLHPKEFDAHLRIVLDSPFVFVERFLFHDRLWFQLNANLKSLHHVESVKAFLRSVKVAKVLGRLSSLAGPRGSKHLGIILQKI